MSSVRKREIRGQNLNPLKVAGGGGERALLPDCKKFRYFVKKRKIFFVEKFDGGTVTKNV